MRHRLKEPIWSSRDDGRSDPPEGSAIRGLAYGLGPALLVWIIVGLLLWWAFR